MEVGAAPIDHLARIDTKVKASELKVGLSKKGLSLQEIERWLAPNLAYEPGAKLAA